MFAAVICRQLRRLKNLSDLNPRLGRAIAWGYLSLRQLRRLVETIYISLRQLRRLLEIEESFLQFYLMATPLACNTKETNFRRHN
jgi:hypothetical protein